MDTFTENSTTSTPDELHSTVAFSGNDELLTRQETIDNDSFADDTNLVDNSEPLSSCQRDSVELPKLKLGADEGTVLNTIVSVTPTQDDTTEGSTKQEILEDPSAELAEDVKSLSNKSLQEGQLTADTPSELVGLSQTVTLDESSDAASHLDDLASKITSNFYATAESGDANALFEILNQLTQETNALPKDLVNTPSTFTGLTVLHYAASRGHLTLVEYLIDTGAEVDMVDREGETALLKAAFNGHLNVVKHLINNQAFVHHKDNDGCTALHNACSSGCLGVVKWLLENTTVDVNVRNKMNHTPLMNAASRGFLNIVNYLVNEANADPSIKNDFGEKAYDVAAARMEAQICELLDEMEKITQVNYDTIQDHQTVLMILYENQQAPQSLLSRLASPRFSLGSLSEGGARSWTLVNGRPSSKEAIQLPAANSESSTEEEWFWLTDWQIDLKHSQVDSEEGWQYAYSFDALQNQWYRSPPGAGLSSNWVRRRRWIRVMKRKLSSGEHSQEVISDGIEGSTVPSSAYLEPGDSSHLARGSNVIAIQNGDNLDYSSSNHLRDESRTSRSLQNTDINLHLDTESEFRRPSSTNRSLARSNTVSVMGGAHLRQTSNVSSLNTDSTAGISPSLLQVLNSSSARLLPLSPSLWESDEDAPDCRQCGRKFMIFLRRHHCRRCGLVFCDRCTSSRFPFPVPSPAEDNFTISYQRVCDTCLALLNSLPKSANPLMNSSLMSRTNSQASLMNECPVCFTPLQSISTERGAQERHVQECLETREFSTSPKGSRSLNFKLKEDSNLLGQECPICFEEFALDETIARLTCLCTYHQECIDSWFGRGKQCPFHSG